MAKKKTAVLRAIQEKLGSSRYYVQNLDKGTEYLVDTEQMTCNCPGYEHRRKCHHLDHALYRAKLYAGDPEANYEAVRRTLESVWHW